MKTLKYLAIGAMALFATACTESAIDDLTGLYQAPTNYEFTSASDEGVEKEGNKRIFNVSFTNNSGDVLKVKFVGDKYFLHSAAFTPATSDNLKNGNYIIGSDGATFQGAGQSAKYVQRGQIVITKDEDNYGIGGNLWLEDGNVIKLNGSFVLHYESDPEPVHLSKVLSVTNNVPNGTNSISLQLATDEISSAFDPATWSTTYSGSGNYLAVDFYSEDGNLAPGVYSPADSNSMSAFTYGKGWDPGDLWGIGMVFTNWGTCWWTVDNGATSAVHIEEGDIEVKLAGGVYTISYNFGGIFFEFKGAIDGMGQGGEEVEYLDLSKFLSFTNNVPNGSNSVTVKVGTDGIDTSANMWGGVDITGDGNYVAIDFYSADGTLASGVYTPAENYEMSEGTFAKGWDPGDLWGIGMEFTNWGSCWFTREGGMETGLHLDDGTITVEQNGDQYTIVVSCNGVNAKYVGEILM